jgi:hypothetical protein
MVRQLRLAARNLEFVATLAGKIAPWPEKLGAGSL